MRIKRKEGRIFGLNMELGVIYTSKKVETAINKKQKDLPEYVSVAAKKVDDSLCALQPRVGVSFNFGQVLKAEADV